MVKIFIPSCSEPKIEVLESLKRQSVLVEIEIVPGIFENTVPKRKRIAMAKEECKKKAITSGLDFVLFNDDDLYHIYPENIKSMIGFLEKNTLFGAVSLYRGIAGHICNGVTMFRKKALEIITFLSSDTDKPTCFALQESLKKNGFNYGYSDNVTRIIHLQ